MMHPDTKFRIHTPKILGYAQDTIILETRSEVKATVTRKWYETLLQPKIHPHTKIWVPTSKNLGDMRQILETSSVVKVTVLIG